MPGLRRSAAALLALAALAGPARADDRHVGYYYPPPANLEAYEGRVETLPDSSRGRRIGFVTLLTKQLLEGRYAPPYAVFAKGEEAEKMIIVALADGPLDTIYRARAVLANLTAMARLSPFFRENAIADQATFLDLLKLLGYEQLTVTDGRSFAHQVLIR